MVSHLDLTYDYTGWEVKYTHWQPATPSTQDLKTILFVHGTPWASDVFVPIARALFSTQRYNIVLYDLLGYGASQGRSKHGTAGTCNEDTSCSTQAKLLTSLLAHLSLDGKDSNEKPLVIAHDIAGVIALRTHLVHGCQFASLCLLDTNVVLPWGDKFYNMVRDNRAVFSELSPHISEAMIRAVTRSATASGAMPQHWEDTLVHHWSPPAATASAEERGERQRNFIRQIADANDRDVAEMLGQDMYSKIACDVKILWGEKDTWIPREKMERLARVLGDKCRAFVTIPDAGHLIMIDQPERVMLEVAMWVENGR